MAKVVSVVVVLAFLGLSLPSWAQEVPGDCMASFNVNKAKVTADIAWILATGKTAAMSCGSGELLRERLFIEGDKVLSVADLTGTPDEAARRALSAYNDLEKRIKEIPGEDVSGTIFAGGGYLVSKYLLVSCLLSAEAGGGTCWAAAATFLGKTFGFYQEVSENESNKLKKQKILSALRDIKPALDAVKPAAADLAGARSRWVQTQTNLCRAVQKDCF